MGDLDNLQTRLAREEATLSTTHDQIEAAHQRIAALRQQIQDIEREIQATESRIQKLQAHTKTVEKRMALLQEYINMVESGESPLETAEASPTAELEAAAHAQPAAETAAGPASATGDESLDVQLTDLPSPSESGADDDAAAEPVTLETIDDQSLTYEILPRTETFGEELLLVLAHHRKSIAPKDVVKVFRRLDYAPKSSATEENVQSQVESEPHFYESAARGKIALTREGREEAQRLLERLA